MSYVKELYQDPEFKRIVPFFKRKSTVSLNGRQRDLLRKAYVEIGGEPFSDNCGGCIPDVFQRFLKHTQKEYEEYFSAPSTQTNTNQKANPIVKKLSKDQINLINSNQAGELSDGTIVKLSDYPQADPIKSVEDYCKRNGITLN